MRIPNTIIRDITPSDAASLTELDRRLAEDGRGMVNTPEQIRSVEAERQRIETFLSDSGASIELVAVNDEIRVIANAKIQQVRPKYCQHVGIVMLGVDPDFQNQGLGRAMLEALLKRADTGVLLRLELYVRADNARAIKLYESMGFEREGVRRNFIHLPDGSFVDDVIMVRFN